MRSAGAVLHNIFPIARHNTTGFMNHMRTILYWGSNVYMRKFWYFWPKLSQVQLCSLVQDCWRMIHKISCIMPWNVRNGRQDSQRREQSSTKITWRVLYFYKLLYISKGSTEFIYISSICKSYNNTSTNLCPYSESTFAGCLRHFGTALRHVCPFNCAH